MNSNSNKDIIINEENNEERNLNLYQNNENIDNSKNQNNIDNNILLSSNNNSPIDAIEKLNSSSINEYINSLLLEIKKLNAENQELKLNFVQVSELREKETQNYKYNLNVLRSNIEILEQDKQRHINQNIIEKENLENQIQILMKENNMLNQRIKQIIEQNEILNKQIFDSKIVNFSKNKKPKNLKQTKNRINKNNKINSNIDAKNNNSQIKRDKNMNVYNNNLKSKNTININISKMKAKFKIIFRIKYSSHQKIMRV